MGGSRSRSVQIMTDPDPRGPKTYGSETQRECLLSHIKDESKAAIQKRAPKNQNFALRVCLTLMEA
jgi:hypothetical protein